MSKWPRQSPVDVALRGACPRCGSIDPGTAPTAIRNSSTSAVRIEVSWRHIQRRKPSGPRATGPRGGSRSASGAVDSAVSAAFADAPCKGLEYAGEQARLVYAGRQPAAKLMPGAKE